MNAEEVCSSPGRVDLGTPKERGPNSFNGRTTEEVRRTLLQRSYAAGLVGLPSLRTDVTFSQEATGGEDLNNGPGSTTGDTGIGPHSLWVQSNGENEHTGGRIGTSAFSTVSLRD